jgi:hypothetical protein
LSGDVRLVRLAECGQGTVGVRRGIQAEAGSFELASHGSELARRQSILPQHQRFAQHLCEVDRRVPRDREGQMRTPCRQSFDADLDERREIEHGRER